jgi:DnaJ-class molecular chaperone
MRILSRIARQIIIHATCPHCRGKGTIYNPPVGPITCGGCQGTGQQ